MDTTQLSLTDHRVVLMDWDVDGGMNIAIDYCPISQRSEVNDEWSHYTEAYVSCEDCGKTFSFKEDDFVSYDEDGGSFAVNRGDVLSDED